LPAGSGALQLLVCEAYPRKVREQLRGAGAREAGRLWAEVLQALEPESQVEVLCVADLDCALPPADELSRYQGVVWTGSSLTVYESEDPRVGRQLEFVREVAAAGIPQFGSCWGIQLAATAFGGRCQAHPLGREFGVAESIHLLAGATAHPLYAGKPLRFSAFTSHADHVTRLPPSATWLAANVYSPVQALALTVPAPFWGVQYHPEYDFREIARLCVFRAEELLAQGRFASARELEDFVAAAEALHDDPGCSEAARALGADTTLLDEAVRRCEIRNWLSFVKAQRDPRP
jgi:GMP synthase (glutamine-hydrolysing)